MIYPIILNPPLIIYTLFWIFSYQWKLVIKCIFGSKHLTMKSLLLVAVISLTTTAVDIKVETNVKPIPSQMKPKSGLQDVLTNSVKLIQNGDKGKFSIFIFYFSFHWFCFENVLIPRKYVNYFSNKSKFLDFVTDWLTDYVTHTDSYLEMLSHLTIRTILKINHF